MALTEKVCYGMNCRGHVNKPIAMFAVNPNYPDGYARKCSECLQAEADMVDADRGIRRPAAGPQWSVPTGKPAPIPVIQKKEKPVTSAPDAKDEPRASARSKTASLPENFVELIDGYKDRGYSWRNIGDIFAKDHGCDAGWTNISQAYYKKKRERGASKPAVSKAQAEAPAPRGMAVAPGASDRVRGMSATFIETDGPQTEGPQIDPREEGIRLAEEQRIFRELHRQESEYLNRAVTAGIKSARDAAEPYPAGPELREPAPALPPAERGGARELSAEDACVLQESVRLFEERARQLEVEANNYRDMARRTREMLHG